MGWDWKAISLALAVDVVGAQILGALLAIPFVLSLASRGVSEDDITENLLQSTAFLKWCFVIGVAMDFLGGFLAARWASNRTLEHAAIVGVGAAVFTLLINASFNFKTPLWFKLSWILALPAALLGGWLGLQILGAA